jgi:histidine ammonia-lyase
LALDQYIPVLQSFANSNQGSPVVLVDTQELVSLPDFDTSQVTLGMDALRAAIGLVAVGSNSRALKMISHPFIDLPSGLVAGDPDAFDGIYTRNITYTLTSLERAALIEAAPVFSLTESYMAEGDEDYSLMGSKLVGLVEKVSALEALIGSVAIERRVESGAMTAEHIPAPIRAVQSASSMRSPLRIPIDKQYDLTPLFDYYRTNLLR